MKIQTIISAINTLKLSGKPVCIHMSYKSFGPDGLEGGPAALLDSFLQSGCTVIVPSHSWVFYVHGPDKDRLIRNAFYKDAPIPKEKLIYTPDSNVIDKDMGVFAATVVNTKDRIRGNHPLCSFAAIGPDADKIIKTQQSMDVFAPIKAIAAQDGFILMAGTKLNKMTALHLAEQLSGRNMFIRWAYDKNENIIRAQAGGCSEGFFNLSSALDRYMQKISVGQSEWACYSADKVLKTASALIKADPSITHCGDAQCVRCNDAVAGGPEELQ